MVMNGGTDVAISSMFCCFSLVMHSFGLLSQSSMSFELFNWIFIYVHMYYSGEDIYPNILYNVSMFISIRLLLNFGLGK